MAKDKNSGGSFPGMNYSGKLGNLMKSKKGVGAVKNGSGGMGIGGLKSKKPVAKIAKGKGNTKVSGKTSALASKSPKKLKASSNGPVSHGKGRVNKLEKIVF